MARRNLFGFIRPIDPVSTVLILMVTRKNIVKDTIAQLEKQGPGDLKKPLRVCHHLGV